MYETLLAPTNTHNPSDKASYPHVRTLLEFDTREFLNVLAMVSSDTSVVNCVCMFIDLIRPILLWLRHSLPDGKLPTAGKSI